MPFLRRLSSTMGMLGLLAAVAVAISVASMALLLAEQPPGDDSPEAGFARDMSAHHAQAVEMAQIVSENTTDPQMERLSTNIALTQQGQIGRMQGMLSDWGLSIGGSGERMRWMGHSADGRMPGMASSEEVDELRSVSGEESDRLFLRLMIPHHEAAIPMSQAVLERTDRPAVEELAQAISSSQKAEIQTMQDLLREKGGKPPKEGSEDPGSGDMQSMEGM